MKKVIIIGGGAAGMMAAISASEEGKEVILLERNEKLGKKLFITGKGRCNLTNNCPKEEFLNNVVTNARFMYSSFSRFTNNDMIRMMEESGLKTKVERGQRVFPLSDRSSDVIGTLKRLCDRNQVKIRCHAKAAEILVEGEEKTAVGVRLDNGEKIYGDAVIVAAGGCSYSSTGSDGSGYTLVKSLGHSVVPVVPALVQLKVKDFAFQKASGVRTDAKVTALINGRMAVSDTGELQITNYGISGIPVFQVSRYISRALYEKQNAQVMIDFLPELEEASLRELFSKKLQHLSENQKSKPEDLLTGILHTKLIPEILRISGIRFSAKLNMIKGAELTRLCEVIKSCRLNISDTNGFDNAQVSAGGVSLKEVDMETMQSCITKDLYLAGGLLDVDGICGGYNLQWAWATGYLAGKHAASDL